MLGAPLNNTAKDNLTGCILGSVIYINEALDQADTEYLWHNVQLCGQNLFTYLDYVKGHSKRELGVQRQV